MTPSKQAAVDAAVATVKATDETNRVRCYLADGDVRELALPTGRYRWKQLSQTLEAYDWTRLELLARDGAVLGVYDHPEGGMAGELETLAAKPSKVQADLAGIVTLFLHGQKQALDQQYKLVVAATSAQSAALEASTARLKSMEESMAVWMKMLKRATADQMDSAAEAAELIAEAAGGDDPDDPTSQLKVAVLAQLLPKLLQGVGGAGGTGAPPAAGAA